MEKRNKLHFAGSDMILERDEFEADFLQALMDCGDSGDALPAVRYVMENYEISGEFDDCVKFLRPYGAWEDEELSDHETNIERLVWLVGCGLKAESAAYLSGY